MILPLTSLRNKKIKEMNLNLMNLMINGLILVEKQAIIFFVCYFVGTLSLPFRAAATCLGQFVRFSTLDRHSAES